MQLSLSMTSQAWYVTYFLPSKRVKGKASVPPSLSWDIVMMGGLCAVAHAFLHSSNSIMCECVCVRVCVCVCVCVLAMALCHCI